MRCGVHGISRGPDRPLAPGAHRLWDGPGVKQPTLTQCLKCGLRVTCGGSPGELIEDEIPGPHLGATYQPQLWNQPLRLCTFKNALSILSKCVTNVDKNSLLCVPVAMYINRFRVFFGSLFLKFNLH